MATKTTGKSGGGKGKHVDREARQKQREQLGEKTYLLGPQEDGSVVLRVSSDFDLMILRKACEKQKKNADAAVGTIGALADGDDPMIDAVKDSLNRLLGVINRSRAPENQIADTPIGREIERASSESDDNETHHGGMRRWADAVPRPRPQPGDVVQFPDADMKPIVDALGFKGDGLTGSESEDELRQLAEQGKLAGAFDVIVEKHDGNVLVQHAGIVSPSGGNVWRVAGAAYDGVELPSAPPPSGNNIASTVGDVVERATSKTADGRKRESVKRSKSLPSGKRK